MAVKLESPHAFAERFLLFGGGGAGKTETVLNIASHLAHGTMHVLDADYSMAYDRAIATTYEDAADRMNIVPAEPEWEPFTKTLAGMIPEMDPAHDWLVIDPISPTWEAVQSWYLEQVYEHDLASHIVALRKAHVDDVKEYNKALTNDMNWQAVKKEYGAKIWGAMRKWRGNLIMCAEAKALSHQDNDETQQVYGPLGVKPVGEARMTHVAATNLFLDHPKRGTWRMTTIKDRNRGELDKTPIEDFGMDYLVEIAGWVRAKKAK